MTSPGAARRHRALGLVLVAATAAAALAACRPLSMEWSEDHDPAPVIEPVATSPELAPTAEVSRGWELAPPSGGLPGVASAVRTAPGEAGRAGLWLWGGGAGMARVTSDLGIPGSVTSVHLAAGASRVLLAVTSWDGHTLLPSLRVSTDRSSWSAVGVPSEAAGVRWETAGAVGEVLVAAGSDRSGGALVLALDGAEQRVAALPGVADGEARHLLGVAGQGGQLVVLAAVGPRGGLGTIGAYVSSDAGRTFGAFTPVDPDGWAEADGVVWTGTAYVVTGSVPRSSGDPGIHRPVAWTSSDGVAWAREEVGPLPDPDGYAARYGDVRLGGPAAAPDGTVTAVVSNELRAVSAYVRRDAGGRWSAVEQETSNEAHGVGGRAVLDPDGYLYAVLEHDGGAAFERSSPDGWSKRLGEMTQPDGSLGIGDVAAEPEQLRIVAHGDVSTGTGTEWSSRSVASLMTLDASQGVAPDTEDFPGRADAHRLAFASDAVSGAGVVAATHDAGATSAVTVSFRAGAGQPWEAATGFASPERVSVHLLARTPTGWLAAGFAGESLDAPDGSQRMSVWESTDGRTWGLHDGALVAEDGDAVVRRLCSLQDGTPVAVGGVERAGTERAAVWRRVGEAWTRSDVGPDGVGSRLDSCATTPGGILLGGQVDGSAATWLSADGTVLGAPVVLAGRGVVRSVVAVPGGFAAAGRTDDDEHTGATIWLSHDGAAWSRHAVPARADVDAHLAAVLDGDLVVVLGGDGGTDVRIVRDVEEAIDEAGGGDA